MTDTTRMTSEEIEQDIESRRASLGRTIDELQSRASLDNLFAGWGDALQGHGSDIGRTVGKTVRQNPAALALAGIGVAWFVYSLQQNSGGDAGDDDYRRSRLPLRDDAATYREPQRFAGGTTAPYSRPLGSTGGIGGSDPDHDPWGVQADDDDDAGLATRAKDKAGQVADGARDALRSAGDRAQVGWYRTRARASDLRSKLMDGTDELSSEARARVADARVKALEAQQRLEAMAVEGGRRAKNFYDEHPLAVGVMAAAAGAAIAAMLPRTDREDRALGDYRDRLFSEAEAVYREERDRALRSARKAGDEALNVAREAKDSALGGGGHTPSPSEAVSRVSHAARDAAKTGS